MAAAVTLACLLVVQQLHVEPVPVSVGRQIVVTVDRHSVPAEGVEVSVQLPTGSRRVIGATDAGGKVRFVPGEPGQHAFIAIIDEVRCLAPFAVGPAPKRWLLALASVPLGLALLWLNVRRLVNSRLASRRRADQASTRST